MALRFLALAAPVVLATVGVSSALAPAERSGAARNDASLSYENAAPAFRTLGTGFMASEALLDFDTSGATHALALPITVPPIAPGDSLIIEVEWDHPHETFVSGASAGAVSSIDLCVSGASGSTVVTDYDNNLVRCTGPNAVGADPMQYLVIANPADATGNTPQQTLKIMIGLAANSAGLIAPGRISVSVQDHGLGSTIDSPLSASMAAAATTAAPPAPTLTLGASSIHAQTTTTLTWSSTGATSCTASGNANADQSGWSGVQAPSATFTITPLIAGSYVYSLTCSNAAGTSPTASVSLTVSAPTDTGGGGRLDPAALLGLVGCVLLLRRRLMR